jgi:hypothetical protein
MIADPQRFETAMARFDAANAEDPQQEICQGKSYPRELLYAQRMSQWLARLDGDASEPLQLAARSQHIRRWEIPRGDFPPGRAGYHQWRTTLYGFHAEKAGAILVEVGYDQATVARVRDLLRKRHLKSDPEMQLLEDVICLVFLESYFPDFARRHDEPQLLTIVQKTWKKMSPRGHQAALELPWTESDLALIRKALASHGQEQEPAEE